MARRMLSRWVAASWAIEEDAVFKTLGKATVIGLLAGRAAFTIAMAVVGASTTLLTASILCTSFLGLSPALVVATARVRAATRPVPEQARAHSSAGARASFLDLDGRSRERSGS